MVRSSELQSLASLCSAHTLALSASHDFAPPTSKTWFPVCSQGSRGPYVLPGCMDPKIRSSGLAGCLSTTFLLCAPSDFCYGYLPSLVRISHSEEFLHGYGTELCCPDSNRWKIALAGVFFYLYGHCSSSIPLTHFQPLHR